VGFIAPMRLLGAFADDMQIRMDVVQQGRKQRDVHGMSLQHSLAPRTLHNANATSHRIVLQVRHPNTLDTPTEISSR